MLWPGALSAVFLLQCGSEPDKAARRALPQAGSGGMNGAGEGGEGGACVVCAGTPGAGRGGAEAGAAGRGSGGASGGSSGSGAGAVAGAGRGGGAGVGGSSGDASEGGQAGGATPEDAGVTLTKLAAYQAVEVTLGPGSPTRNAPIVAGRRMLVRAFLTPGPAFPGGAVTGTLSVNDGTMSPLELASSVELDGPSEQADLETTLTFDIAATRVTAATTLSLVVKNADGELLRFPASTPLPLGAQSSSGNLKVTLVPLVVNGFGPDLSEPRVKSYTTLLRGMFPVPSVDVTVRDAYPLDYDVTADGDGWDAALDELYALRAADEPADNVYYYGLLAPAATMDDWCPDGCTVGLSVVAAAGEVEYRGSIGVGFFDTLRDTFSPETLVHELGHAMGRDHSPCGTDDADPRFPYDDGFIGSWGLFNGILRDPSVDADVMGYCTPVWVSDYTFARLFTRISYVNRAVPRVAGATESRAARERVRTLTLGPDGTLRWGRERNGTVRPSESTTNVELLDSRGRVISTVRAPFARFDHLPGGFVTLPASVAGTPGLATVRAHGRTLRFAQ
jgi:hypothetical protein